EWVNAEKGMGRAGDMTFTRSSSAPPPPSGNDTVTIQETSGNTQNNRPVSISRVFVQGEIPGFAQAVVNGTAVLTQCDVKNRWPDGSLEIAVVCLVRTSVSPNNTVTVSFVNQSTGNNSGFLSQ